eukprot:587019-Rhodomonas_salina.1
MKGERENAKSERARGLCRTWGAVDAEDDVGVAVEELAALGLGVEEPQVVAVGAHAQHALPRKHHVQHLLVVPDHLLRELRNRRQKHSERQAGVGRKGENRERGRVEEEERVVDGDAEQLAPRRVLQQRRVCRRSGAFRLARKP